MARLSPALVALFAAAVPGASFAATSVAVVVRGSAKSGADRLEKQVRAQLAADGMELVTERSLERAAKKTGEDPGSVAAAKSAGADLLVLIKIKKKKKVHVASADLIDTKSGRIVAEAKKSYKKATSASAIGDVLGRELAEAAAAVRSGQSPRKRTVAAAEEEDEGEDEEEPAPPKVVAARSGSTATPASAARVTPKDEGASARATVESPSPRGTDPEAKLLLLRVGGGSQVTSAYTVAVGERVTGLAYNLSPLVLFQAGGRVAVPGTGLGVELGFAFVPVKYTVTVEPVVTPDQPKGSFLDVTAAASYRLNVAGVGADGAFYLQPLVGIVYRALTVEAQLPYTVVMSYSQISPKLGTKLGLSLGDLVIEAHAGLEIVLSYSESPERTGDGGGGIGLAFGAGGRYWMSENFGVFLDLSYEYSRITFSGSGTRTPFVNDPALDNATIFAGNLKTALGVALAL